MFVLAFFFPNIHFNTSLKLSSIFRHDAISLFLVDVSLCLDAFLILPDCFLFSVWNLLTPGRTVEWFCVHFLSLFLCDLACGVAIGLKWIDMTSRQNEFQLTVTNSWFATQVRCVLLSATCQSREDERVVRGPENQRFNVWIIHFTCRALCLNHSW